MSSSTAKPRLADGGLRFGLMWFNSQTPYITSAIAAGMNPPVLDVDTQVTFAQAAERAGFDFLFMADGYVGHGEHNVRIGHGEPRLSAPVWAPILMNATKHVGVATTMHTRYLPPAVIARLGANFDTLSGGRWAWNIVPGTKDDPFIGVEPLPHDDRYRHATESVHAVKAIWEARGAEVNFDGDFYHFEGKMMGPFTVQEPFPALFNAGVSPAGQDLIAAECDYGFFAVVDDLDKVRGPVESLAARAEAHGRDPLAVNLIGSLAVVLGKTSKEAHDRHDYLISTLDMDAARAWADSFIQRSATYRDTHGDEADKAARSVGVASGSSVVVGTPAEVAEQILAIHRATGLRGYQILPLTWSLEEMELMGEVFDILARTDVYTKPENRGWSW